MSRADASRVAACGESVRSSMFAPNYGLRSVCSSETANRIMNLKLQLEMERARRKDVERSVAVLASLPDREAFPTSEPLTETALAKLTAQRRRAPSDPPQASFLAPLHRSSADVATKPVPRPPSSGPRGRCDNFVAALPFRPEPLPSCEPLPAPQPTTARPHHRQDRGDVRDRMSRKPPLPPAARPSTHNTHGQHTYGRHKISEVDIYLSRQRHAARLAALEAFDFR